MPAVGHPFPSPFLGLQICTEILRKTPWILEEILVLVEMCSFQRLSPHLLQI